MEEKAVCYYCATIYPAEQEKCPLCGSTKRSEDYVIPQRRERVSEEERKKRQKGGRYAANKASGKKDKDNESSVNAKPFLIAALVFLILAVLALFWFIADMIGWLPGFENMVDRETAAAVSVHTGCTELLAEPTRLNFNAVGQNLELCISVNASCEEKLYCTSNDVAVAEIADNPVLAEVGEYKSATFTITSASEGSTVITVSCGNQTYGIPVTVTDEGGSGNGNASNGSSTPELNWQEVEFTTMDESVQLKVTNLTEGATVIWMSSDESVASVDANGLVTPVGSGETTIICDVDGMTAQVKIRCDIETETTFDDDGAHLESTDVSVKVGEKFPLFLYNSKSEHIDDISYVVDDASICEVVDNYVKALSGGTTKVRVIYGELEFVCIVRVG